MINLDDTPEGEPTPIEKILDFRVKDGMVWVEGKETKGWSVPRIRDMKKAVEVIGNLLASHDLMEMAIDSLANQAREIKKTYDEFMGAQ
jgi:hypothetical protein